MSAGSERLERTRLAILEHIHNKELRRHPREAAATGAGEHPQRRHGLGEGRWVGEARQALGDWWRYHPAHMALDMARPALASYARRKPMQYLGLAAAAGAALFMLRPWKLISVTGLLLGLVKSPQMASMVMSALSSSENPRDDQAPQE